MEYILHGIQLQIHVRHFSKHSTQYQKRHCYIVYNPLQKKSTHVINIRVQKYSLKGSF